MRFVMMALLAILIGYMGWSLLTRWAGRGRDEYDRQITDKTYALQFVYINDDGTARELDQDQKDHLNAEYHGADGNRPYIKAHYNSLTPDGKMRGYLRRRDLPPGIHIVIN